MNKAALVNNPAHFDMVSVGDALKVILASVKKLPEEKEKLTAVFGRVLAEDIYAENNIPQLDNSAMDGYAVRSSDIIGASRENPKTLSVIYDLRAGFLAPQPIKKNQAIRIMTGAPIPRGADSVVMVEYTEKIGKGESVKIFKEEKKDKNIRMFGEDIKKDELVICKGTRLDSAHIGILASLGKSVVKVTRKPRVAILATGDEVIDIDEKLKPEKLRSSNTYTLYSQVIKLGGVPKNLGIAKDNPEELEKKIKEGFDCDLILTSGGVSVGDYDFVKDVLAKLSADIKFWKVRMKPGKPLVFGMVGKIPMFGLPGNPVSSMMSFEVFAGPTILKMLGQKENKQKEVTATLENDLKKKKGSKYFIRAKTRWENGRYLTYTAGPQGSGILKSMALANSLIILPEDDEDIKKGSNVLVRFFI